MSQAAVQHRTTRRSNAGPTSGPAFLQRIPERLRMPLGIAVLAELVYLLWWAAYYPALFSYDSFAYSREVTTGDWVADHSIAYDGAVWLSLVGTGDYALLTLVQTFAMAAVLGYLAAGLRRFGVRTLWIVLMTLLVTALPSTGSFIIYVWKDVPFTIGSSLAFAAIVHLVASPLEKQRYDRRTGTARTWWMLGLGLLVVCLSRNNGFLAAFLIGLALLVVLPRLWKRIAAITLIPIIIFFALSDGVYPALGVKAPPNNATYSFLYGDIAYAYSQHPKTFTQSDLELMVKIAPLKHWADQGANCYQLDPMLSGDFNLGLAVKLNSQLMHVFSEAVERTPMDVTLATLCRSHPAWSITSGADPVGITGTELGNNLGGYAAVYPAMYKNPYYKVMSIRPLLGPLHTLANKWYFATDKSTWIWLVWGGAFWSYAAYAMSGKLWKSLRRREVLALITVTVGNQLNVIAANPAPDYRYMAAPTTVGMLMLPLLFMKLNRNDEEVLLEGLDESETAASTVSAYEYVGAEANRPLPQSTGGTLIRPQRTRSAEGPATGGQPSQPQQPPYQQAQEQPQQWQQQQPRYQQEQQPQYQQAQYEQAQYQQPQQPQQPSGGQWNRPSPQQQAPRPPQPSGGQWSRPPVPGNGPAPRYRPAPPQPPQPEAEPEPPTWF